MASPTLTEGRCTQFQRRRPWAAASLRRSCEPACERTTWSTPRSWPATELVHPVEGSISPQCRTHSKVTHVGQEGVDLDHFLDGRASLLENGLEVGDAGGSLLLDGPFNEVALGVAGDLARAIDGGGRLDGLGLGYGSVLSTTHQHPRNDREHT